MDIDLSNPVPERYEPQIRAALERLVRDNGKDRAWEIVVSVLMAGLNVGREMAERVGRAVVKDVFDKSAPEPTTPPVGDYEWRADRMVLAGVDRDWMMLAPVEVASTARACGCTGVSIEMVGNDSFVSTSFDDISARYNALLAACRARKLVLFVCVVNDWIQAKDWQHVPKLEAAVLGGGPEGVIVQPVGETHTENGKAYEKRCVTLFAGWNRCANGDGGRPKSKPSWADYIAWHSAGLSNAPRGAIEITDHGTSIRDIGYFSVQKVREYARAAKSRGCAFGLYRYVGMGDNRSPASLSVAASAEAWRAISEVYSQKTQSDVPAQPFVDQIDVSRAVWGGTNNKVDPASARITVEMRSAKIVGGNVRVDYSPPASWWGSESDHLKFPRGLAAWREGGTVYVAHYDWFNRGQSVKTIGNLTNGYTRRPVGTVYLAIMSNDQTERTNFVAGGAL